MHRKKLRCDFEEKLARLMIEFNKLFPHEEACLAYIVLCASLAGLLKCHHCGTSYTGKKALRSFVCISCKKVSWLTSGTFLDHIKKPRAWLLAIWLTERGIVLSSSRLSKLADISQSAALNILRRVRIVLENQIGDFPLEAPTSDFLPVMIRRTRMTPALGHPREEDAAFKKSGKTAASASSASSSKATSAPSSSRPATSGFSSRAAGATPSTTLATAPMSATTAVIPASKQTLSAQDRQIIDLLGVSSKTFDELCKQLNMPAHDMSVALTILEVSGIISNVGGNCYRRIDASLLPQPRTELPSEPLSKSPLPPLSAPIGEDAIVDVYRSGLVEKINEFVCTYFHGVSRKYLQNYIAAHWCYETKERWRDGGLLRTCLKSRWISYEQMLDYVSPALVKLCDTESLTFAATAT